MTEHTNLCPVQRLQGQWCPWCEADDLAATIYTADLSADLIEAAADDAAERAYTDTPRVRALAAYIERHGSTDGWADR